MKGGRVIFRFRFCLKCLIEQLCEQTKRFNIVVVSYTRVLITSTYHSSHTHTHTHTHNLSSSGTYGACLGEQGTGSSVSSSSVYFFLLLFVVVRV